jgi:PBP1b-binding outer membrane lipoprotein LpoB
MKKQLLVCAIGAFLFVGCNNTAERQETTITETETVTTETVEDREMDVARMEIEKASAEVDSLLNEI